MACDGKELAGEPDERILFRLDFDLFLAEHLDSGVDQEGAEDVDDPVEVVNQRRADEDHRQTHDQRAHHAPEQHAMLKLRWDLEIGKDQKEDKEVIDGQRQLDEVAGEKLETPLRAEIAEDDAGKQHRNGYPNAAPNPSFAIADSVSFTIEEAEIQTQHGENE